MIDVEARDQQAGQRLCALCVACTYTSNGLVSGLAPLSMLLSRSPPLIE